MEEATKYLRQRLFSFVVLLCWVLVVFSGIMHFLHGFDGDKNWLLTIARMVFHGKRLYVDIFETNPPLIIWIYLIPTWLSTITGVENYTLLILLTHGLVLLSIVLSDAAIACHPHCKENQYVRSLHALLLAGILIFFANIPYFGDREHIFITCVIPYLLRCMPSLSSRTLTPRLRIAIGLLAAIGFCIKPHTIIFFGFVQLLPHHNAQFWKNIFRTENIIIYVFALLYLLAIACITPEYISVMVPMLHATYGAYVTVRPYMVYYSILLSFFVAFAFYRREDTSPLRADINYLRALCVAGILYMLASNGWPYTFYPLGSMVSLSVGWVWAEYAWLKTTTEKSAPRYQEYSSAMRLCFLVFAVNIYLVAVNLGLLFVATDMTAKPQVPYIFEKAVTENHATSYGGMSTSFTLLPDSMAGDKITYAVRFHFLWMLPKFIISDPEFRKANEWIIAYVARGYAEDLNHNKPDIMFVDTSPYFIYKYPFNIISTLNDYPEFAAAWKHYSLVQIINRCSERVKSTCRYEVFKRVP